MTLPRLYLTCRVNVVAYGNRRVCGKPAEDTTRGLCSEHRGFQTAVDAKR